MSRRRSSDQNGGCLLSLFCLIFLLFFIKIALLFFKFIGKLIASIGGLLLEADVGIGNFFSTAWHDIESFFDVYGLFVAMLLGYVVLSVLMCVLCVRLYRVAKERKIVSRSISAFKNSRENKLASMAAQWDDKIIHRSRAIARIRFLGKPADIIDVPAERNLIIEADKDASFRRFRDRQYCFRVASQNLPDELLEYMADIEKNRECYERYMEQVCKIWDQYGGQCVIEDIPSDYLGKRERALFDEICAAAPVTDVMIHVRVVHIESTTCDPIRYDFVLSVLVQARKDAIAHGERLAQYAVEVDAVKSDYDRAVSDLAVVETEYEDAVRQVQQAEEQKGKAFEEYKGINDAISQKKDDIATLDKTAVEKRSEIARLNKMASSKRAEFRQVENVIQRKQRDIEVLDQTAMEKRFEIARLDKLVSKKLQSSHHSDEDIWGQLNKFSTRFEQKKGDYEKTFDPNELTAFKANNIKWPDWVREKKTIRLEMKYINTLSNSYRGNGVAAKGDVTGCYVLMNLDEGNKPYVGQAKKVFKRWRQHIKGQGSDGVHEDLERGCSFSATVIPLSGTTFPSLDAMEGALIEYFDACNRGYNKTTGNGMYR